MSANITPFNSDGGFTTAGNITGGTANLVAINGPSDAFFDIKVTDTGPGAILQLGDWDIAGFPKSLVQVSDNVHIVTGVTTGGGDWNFDTNGHLTAPGDITITNGTFYGNNFTVADANGAVQFNNFGTVLTEEKPGDNQNYPATATTAITPATGTGCLLNVSYVYGDPAYSVSTSDGGTYSYNVGDQLKVLGNIIGGATPANDLIVQVASLYAGPVPGAVFDVSVVSGTPPVFPDGFYVRNNNLNWIFGTDGNLTLPTGGASINYANGSPYGGGGANTGNVTFSDQIVIGTGISNLVSGLYLAPSSSSANAVQYLRVRGDVTYEPTHIHFDTGNNQYFNQFIGDDNKYVLLSNTGNIVINTSDYGSNTAQWTFGVDGEFYLPTGGRIGATKGGTMLDGGNANSTSLTSFYANGNYSGCFTAYPDGNVAVTTYGDGTGQLGQWTFSGANLLLASQNVSGNVGESAIVAGTRKIVNGQYSGAAYGYSAELAAGGTPSVAYTATNEYVQSVRLTFAVESVGSSPQWEQFDVVATKSLDTPGSVNFVVSNRIKGRSSIADTTVTATVNLANEIEISLNLDAAQTTGGWSSFDAVEFGVMFN